MKPFNWSLIPLMDSGASTPLPPFFKTGELIQWIKGTDDGLNLIDKIEGSGIAAPTIVQRQAYTLSGVVGEHIVIPLGGLTQDNALGACTISGRARIDSHAANSCLFAYGNSAYRIFYAASTDNFRLNSNTVLPFAVPPAGEWFYFSATFNEAGEGISAQIGDEAPWTGVAPTGAATVNVGLILGERYSSGYGQSLNGALANVSVTATTYPEFPTHLPLEGSTYDVSGNGNDGTLEGGTWVPADGVASYLALNGFTEDTGEYYPALNGPTQAVMTFENPNPVLLNVTGLPADTPVSCDGTATPTAEDGIIRFVGGGTAYNISINGELVYKVTDVLGIETTVLTSLSSSWPDAVFGDDPVPAQLPTLEDIHNVWKARMSGSGPVVDAATYQPITQQGGYTQNQSPTAVQFDAVNLPLVTPNPMDFAEFTARLQGTNNVFLKWKKASDCCVDEILIYDQAWTIPLEDQLEILRYCKQIGCGDPITFDGPVRRGLLQWSDSVADDAFGPADELNEEFAERPRYSNSPAWHIEDGDSDRWFSHSNIPHYMWETGIFDFEFFAQREVTGGVGLINNVFGNHGGLRWGWGAADNLFQFIIERDGGIIVAAINEDVGVLSTEPHHYRIVGNGSYLTLAVDGVDVGFQYPISNLGSVTLEDGDLMYIGQPSNYFRGYLGGVKCRHDVRTYTEGDHIFLMEEGAGPVLFNSLGSGTHAIVNPDLSDVDISEAWVDTDILPCYGQVLGCSVYNADPIQRFTLFISTGFDLRLWVSSGGVNYNFTVDWGDGTHDSYSGTGSEIRGQVWHTYAGIGQKLVTVAGEFPRINFVTSSGSNLAGALTAVTNLGISNLQYMAGAFYNCVNMTVFTAGDTRTASVTNWSNAFYGCRSLSFDIGTMSFALCEDFTGFLAGTALSNADYNALLIRINETSEVSGWDFDALQCRPSGEGQTAKNELAAKGNRIYDGLTPRMDTMQGVLTEGVNSLITEGDTLASVGDLFSSSTPGVSYTRNPDFWAADVDISCTSVYYSYLEPSERRMTLVTERHAIVASHFNGYTKGETVGWVDQDNNYTTRTVAGVALDTETDIGVVTFDSDVDAALYVCDIAPSNWRNYISLDGSDQPYGPRIPVLYTNKEDQGCVYNLDEVATGPDTDDQLVCKFLQPICEDQQVLYDGVGQGDSSNPIFFIRNGAPELISTFWTSDAGPALPDHIDLINSLIADADADAGDSTGYTVTESGWSTL